MPEMKQTYHTGINPLYLLPGTKCAIFITSSIQHIQQPPEPACSTNNTAPPQKQASPNITLYPPFLSL